MHTLAAAPNPATPMAYARRNFPLLFIGQFLSAFGDNALLAVIVGQLTYLQQAGLLSADGLRVANTVYTSLLFVPYVVLAPLAGYLNDRYSKTSGLAAGNLLKLAGALLATFLSSSPVGVGIGYFIVGIGACVYGPAKYGILPEILPRDKLVRGNGWVELLTLLAILTGVIGGSKLSDLFHARPLIAFLSASSFFAVALGLSLVMKQTPDRPAMLLSASVREFGSHLRELCFHSRLIRVLLGTALFWVCGAAIKINFQPWGLQVLGLRTNTEIALLGLWLSFGVMIGSVIAGRIHRVGDLRATRYYGLALAAMLTLLFFVSPSPRWLTPQLHLGGLNAAWPVVIVLVSAGVAAGLFLIPLNAALQSESDPEKLGKTIAVQNLSDNLGMCLAGAYVFIATKAGLSPSGIFLGLAIAVSLAMLGLKLHDGRISRLEFPTGDAASGRSPRPVSSH